MTNQRSLMEQVNVNRARRDATSLDSLNRTLETLEAQLRGSMQPEVGEETPDIADRFAALASRAGQSALPEHIAQVAQPATSSASLPSEEKHDLSAIAAQLKQLRDEMRDDIETTSRGELHGETMNRLRHSTTHERAPYGRSTYYANEAEAALGSLERRLNEMHRTVDAPSHVLPLHNVEEKLNLLTGAVEQMSRRHGSGIPTQFMQQMDERLDEISRAIVATARPAALQYAEADAFERVEARISSLASTIESATHDRTSDVILKRMGELAHHIEQLNKQHGTTTQNLDILAEQLSAVARHLQSAPAAISISDFRDLEGRVLQIISKLDAAPQPAAVDPAFIEKMDQRFEELTRRLDQHHTLVEHNDIRLTDNLEARFDDMARYFAENLPQADGTKDAIRSLELQIAGLAERLAQSNDRDAEIAKISPRLEAIEVAIAGNRDLVVEAARNAAAEAIRNTANFGSDHDNSIARELADDLKTLEKLARRSDERNGRTFEAIHDTLLKIVDRLASLESGAVPIYKNFGPAESTAVVAPDAPLAETATFTKERVAESAPAFDAPLVSAREEQPASDEIVDAEIATETPRERKSLFGSLTRSLKVRGKREAAAQEPSPDLSDDIKEEPATEIDADILNRPLEPGSGMPDLNSILKRVRDERRDMSAATDIAGGKADFITAARRAAQAAATEAENQKRGIAFGDGATDGTAKSGIFSRQRKPILLAIGAIMIAIAGLQLKNAFVDHPGTDLASKAPEPATPEEPAITQEQPQAEPQTNAAPESPAENNASAVSQPAPAQDPVAGVINSERMIDPVPATVPATGASSAVLPFIPVEAGSEPLRDAATKGDSRALFEIGNRYMEGRGVESDYAKAIEWFDRAAERGFAPAEYRLGNFYEKGLGVTRDLAKAKSYYELAAGKGNASAMHNLAVLFAGGADGVPDNEAAARWFAQAAELGVKDSQFNLAILSAKGMGVPQNLEESYKWFALAAKAGDVDAAQKREDVAKVMKPEQLERARAAVELWNAKPLNPDANATNVPAEWRDSPAVTGSVTSGALDMEKAIRNVQLILNKNGYDAGGSDGKIGTKTRDAIMAFQKDNGLKPTGNIDKDFVRNLLQKNKQI
ncbi:SEL1-like repeat protein [Phyllobacterium sp. CL33Tsu]|uniref:SEL1-like repeat protein n=1 Tax=Phyllobacterium sp. CL33Tsu TaxID=1798191 RepID=UPI0015875557|nr:SEL1-like repeat protein [Phyllobacterium sp. CL33Tsu]